MSKDVRGTLSVRSQQFQLLKSHCMNKQWTGAIRWYPNLLCNPFATLGMIWKLVSWLWAVHSLRLHNKRTSSVSPRSTASVWRSTLTWPDLFQIPNRHSAKRKDSVDLCRSPPYFVNLSDLQWPHIAPGISCMRSVTCLCLCIQAKAACSAVPKLSGAPPWSNSKMQTRI